MNNKPETHIQLNDGKTILSRWTRPLKSLPTIGDVIHIDSVGGINYDGYRTEATVTRIEQNLAKGVTTLILEATPVSNPSERNVVYLNANYIPETNRRQVEQTLRARIELPVFEWVRSTEPRAIIRHHGPARLNRGHIKLLQSVIDDLLAQSSPLTICG